MIEATLPKASAPHSIHTPCAIPSSPSQAPQHRPTLHTCWPQLDSHLGQPIPRPRTIHDRGRVQVPRLSLDRSAAPHLPDGGRGLLGAARAWQESVNHFLGRIGRWQDREHEAGLLLPRAGRRDKRRYRRRRCNPRPAARLQLRTRGLWQRKDCAQQQLVALRQARRRAVRRICAALGHVDPHIPPREVAHLFAQHGRAQLPLLLSGP